MVADDGDDSTIPLRRKLDAIAEIVRSTPLLTVGIIFLSIFATVLKGVGLSFLVPVIEIAHGITNPDEMSTLARVFINVFEFLGVPFNLEFVILAAMISFQSGTHNAF